MKFKTQYSERVRKISTYDDVSLIDESYKDECDISLMVERYRVSKIPPRTVDVQYGKSPTVEEFQNAQYLLSEIKSNFEGLPAKVRDEFGNDVNNYLAYIGDAANLRDSYERGLINRDSVSIEDVYPELYRPVVEPPSGVTEPSVTPSTGDVQKEVNANS